MPLPPVRRGHRRSRRSPRDIDGHGTSHRSAIRGAGASSGRPLVWRGSGACGVSHSVLCGRRGRLPICCTRYANAGPCLSCDAPCAPRSSRQSEPRCSCQQPPTKRRRFEPRRTFPIALGAEPNALPHWPKVQERSSRMDSYPGPPGSPYFAPRGLSRSRKFSRLRWGLASRWPPVPAAWTRHNGLALRISPCRRQVVNLGR
jgi:hypothetical protein